jgi:hypothetical protein
MYNEVTSAKIGNSSEVLDLLESVNSIIGELESKISPILLPTELEQKNVRQMSSQVIMRLQDIHERLLVLKNRVNI